MKALFKSQPFSIGLAMFAMFFGAGNIIYPLAIGQYAGDQTFFAILGLVLTAAIVPMIGVIAMILFDGDYRQFFGRLGRIPGFILALTIISLLGPLGSTPRCIALSYTTLKGSFLTLSPSVFSAVACSLLFLFALRQKHLLSLLAWVLTPLLLTSLLIIIVVGWIFSPDPHQVDHASSHLFFHGLREGYNTMDLLASFFFSSTIITILKMRFNATEIENKSYLKIALQASLVGAFLLAAIYIGFSYLSAFHASYLEIGGADQLLAAITLKIAGNDAGFLVCTAIALACLTTAIALISAFTDFVQKEVFQEKISYEVTLAGALFLTFLISTFEFTAISAFLWPILQICYPALIVLTVCNVLYKLLGWSAIRGPVCCAFAYSVIAYFF